jgi:hypothetical protein
VFLQKIDDRFGNRLVDLVRFHRKKEPLPYPGSIA